MITNFNCKSIGRPLGGYTFTTLVSPERAKPAKKASVLWNAANCKSVRSSLPAGSLTYPMALKNNPATVHPWQNGQVQPCGNRVFTPGHRHLGANLQLPFLAVIEHDLRPRQYALLILQHSSYHHAFRVSR